MKDMHGKDFTDSAETKQRMFEEQLKQSKAYGKASKSGDSLAVPIEYATPTCMKCRYKVGPLFTNITDNARSLCCFNEDCRQAELIRVSIEVGRDLELGKIRILNEEDAEGDCTGCPELSPLMKMLQKGNPDEVYIHLCHSPNCILHAPLDGSGRSYDSPEEIIFDEEELPF